MKHSCCIILNLLLLVVAFGCIHSFGYASEYNGKVLAADTKEPIEGVVVLGVWSVHHPNAAGGWSEFYDAKETVTNKNGEFSIPAIGTKVVFSLDSMRVVIFRAGYKYIESSWDNLKKNEKVRWEGDVPLFFLKHLTIEERKRQTGPPFPPTEAPLKKVILMLKEINKDRGERGLSPISIWRGEKI